MLTRLAHSRARPWRTRRYDCHPWLPLRHSCNISTDACGCCRRLEVDRGACLLKYEGGGGGFCSGRTGGARRLAVPQTMTFLSICPQIGAGGDGGERWLTAAASALAEREAACPKTMTFCWQPVLLLHAGAGGGGGERRLASAAAALAEHEAAAVVGLAAWLAWPAAALTEPNPKLTKVLKRRLAPQVRSCCCDKPPFETSSL